MTEDKEPRRSRAQVVIEKPETQAIARLDPQELIKRAVESNAGIDTLERLVALAERSQAWSARQAYNRAIVEFQRRCPPIKKTSTATIGDRFSFKYAALDDVMAVIRPILSDLGLSPSWRQAKPSGPATVAVYCRITHDGGHWEESPEPTQMPYRTEGRLSPGQVVSAATSYAQRLSLMGMLGIVPEGEDIDPDDEEARLNAQAQARRGAVERGEPEAAGDVDLATIARTADKLKLTVEERLVLTKTYLHGQPMNKATPDDLKQLALFLADTDGVTQWRAERVNELEKH
jgi:hypothetical protein